MENKNIINQKIYDLKYDPDVILAFNGNKIENVVPKEGKVENGNFIVKTRTKKTISGNYDISVPNSNRDIIYPGALLLANRKLIDNIPDPLFVDRTELKYFIDLPGMENCSFTALAEYDNVINAKEALVNKWIKEYGGKAKIPANMQLQSCVAKDNKQLLLKLGCDISFLQNKLGIDLTSKSAEEKTTYIFQFKQIFYTLSAKMPQDPADVFADTVTWEHLSNKGVGNEAPPVFVRNVAYGREVYIKIESDLDEDDLAIALNGVFTAEKVKGTLDNLSVESKKKLSKTTYTLVALGGSPVVLKGLLTDMDVQKMNEVIFETVDLMSDNPPVPLNYTFAFLKDGKTALISGSSEYTEEKTEMFQSGTLDLEHTGAYIAKFNISWQEIEFDDQGKECPKTVTWDQNEKNKTAKYTTTIALNGNVRNINIKAQGKTGLVWDQWRTSVDKKNLPLVPHRKVKIWGTTLNQKGSVEEG